jgi:hypothetical protein
VPVGSAVGSSACDSKDERESVVGWGAREEGGAVGEGARALGGNVGTVAAVAAAWW